MFKEWSGKWPEDLKIKLKDSIIEADAEYGEKLESEIASCSLTNGIVVSPTDIPPIPTINEVAVA